MSNSIILQHWGSGSLAYRKTQLVTLVLYLMFYLVYTLPFMSPAQPGLIIVFFLRYLIEGISFIMVTHLLVRPTLKQHFQAGPSLKGLLPVCSWLLLASIILALISLLASHLPVFRSTDMSQLTIVEKDSITGLQMQFSQGYILLMMVVMHFSLLLFWSLIYAAWQMRLSRKALEQEMQQARLQQLTNQLSPHFLFNAFNSIRALIYEDQDKAADTVTQLAELFRFHLQAHLRPASSLAEEWQLCQQYLSIEQTRLEERLQVDISIDDSLWLEKMPTLSLLTLLENAIKHGISPTTQAGFIHIKASRNSSHWQLEVSNSRLHDSKLAGTTTGLANLKQRLALMYHNKAQLILHKTADCFSVTLELPYV